MSESNIQKFLEKAEGIEKSRWWLSDKSSQDRDDFAMEAYHTLLEAVRELEKIFKTERTCSFEYTHSRAIGHQEWVPTGSGRDWLKKYNTKFGELMG